MGRHGGVPPKGSQAQRLRAFYPRGSDRLDTRSAGYKRLPLLQSEPPTSYQYPGFRFAPPWAEASYAFGVFSDPPPNKTQLYWKVGIARHPECREREPANGGCEGPPSRPPAMIVAANEWPLLTPFDCARFCLCIFLSLPVRIGGYRVCLI